MTNKLAKAYKGIRVYAELPEKYTSRYKAKKAGLIFTRAGLENVEAGVVTVLAVEPYTRHNSIYDAAGVIQANNPSMIGHTTPSIDYLSTRCLRISKELAHKLHPQMTDFLYAQNEIAEKYK